jgi:hypothetical protein
MIDRWSLHVYGELVSSARVLRDDEREAMGLVTKRKCVDVNVSMSLCWPGTYPTMKTLRIRGKEGAGWGAV